MGFPNPDAGGGGGAVTSVFGRVGAVVAAEGDYTLTQLNDVAITSPATGNALVYTGAGWVNAFPPGYQWDYAAITSTATSTATTAATATAAITGNSVTYDGSTVRIIFSCRSLMNSLSGTVSSQVNVYRDSTDIGIIIVQMGNDTAGKSMAYGSILDTPSAGAHTYSIRHFVASASTSSIQAGLGGAGVTAPAEMRVVKP